MSPSRSYTKRHFTADEIVASLEAKGLSIKDKPTAAREISFIGYNRLRIYLESRRVKSGLGRPFNSGTQLEEILEIYRFDELLRQIIFLHCGRVEVQFRNVVSEVLTETYGCHPFYKDIYDRPGNKADALRLIYDSYFRVVSKDKRATHYFETYVQPDLPPMWTVKELFTFEKSMKFFELLNDNIKTDISRRIGLDTTNFQVLQSWIKSIIDVRNICAHHDRLFNRSLQKQPMRFKKANIPKYKTNKIAGISQCIDYLCQGAGHSEKCEDQILAILVAHTSVDRQELGF